eukprot:14457043-Heterocapsa_arctica.AAC.1
MEAVAGVQCSSAISNVTLCQRSRQVVRGVRRPDSAERPRDGGFVSWQISGTLAVVRIDRCR